MSFQNTTKSFIFYDIGNTQTLQKRLCMLCNIPSTLQNSTSHGTWSDNIIIHRDSWEQQHLSTSKICKTTQRVHTRCNINIIYINFLILKLFISFLRLFFYAFGIDWNLQFLQTIEFLLNWKNSWVFVVLGTSNNKMEGTKLFFALFIRNLLTWDRIFFSDGKKKVYLIKVCVTSRKRNQFNEINSMYVWKLVQSSSIVWGGSYGILFFASCCVF